MKTYIIFDTNILYTREYSDFSVFEFNPIYDEVQGKIERNNVIDKFELRVPDITVKELFKQQLQSYSTNIETIKNAYLKFNQIYEIDLKIDEEFDYEPFLEKKKEQYISSKGVNILSICKEDKFVRIVERALNKEAPFEGKDKKSDKGFKDALIWESILEFAEENEGEYILFTADKGFKTELQMEFNKITGNNIDIYGKNDKQKLDLVIEKYSVERSTRMRLETIYENLESLLDILLKEIEYSAFQEVELNGILCTVNDFEITPKIIDLNEVGDRSFNFILKGKLKAGKTGIFYELKTSLNFLVEIDNSADSKIQLIKLDNIDATSMEDDVIKIANIFFEFLPNYEFVEESPGEDPEENPGQVPGEDPEEVPGEDPEEVPGEDPEEDSGQDPEEDSGQDPEEDPEEVTQEGLEEDAEHNSKDEQKELEIEVNGRATIKESLKSAFLGTELEKNIDLQKELYDIIIEKYTVDWIVFESKKAQMKTAIKTYLRMKNIGNLQIESYTDLVLKELIVNYPIELVVGE